MENETLWSLNRTEGRKILEDPKYASKIKEIETEIKNFQTKDPKVVIHFSAEKAKVLRKDIIRREAEGTDYEGARDYAIYHYEEYSNLTLKELEWLDAWSVSYLVACNGDWESDGIVGHPKGITDEDYIQYYIIGGFPPEDWERKNPLVSFCATFIYVASIRKKELKKTKTSVLRAYLKRHPEEVYALSNNQIPESFPEISETVQLHELVTFWRHHRHNPKMARSGTTRVLEEYKSSHGGEWPSSSQDCVYIIRGYPDLIDLETRVMSNIEKRLMYQHFRKIVKEEHSK